MRDPNRLYNFYNEVTRLQIKYYPDWRVGQFMINFLYWIQNDKKRDTFYIEEDELLTYLKEYCGEEKSNG